MPPHQSHLYSRNGHTIWPNPPLLNNYQHLPHQLHPWMYPQTAHQMSQQQQLPPPQTNQYQKTRHIQPQKYSDSEGSSSHSVSPSSSSNTSSFSSADSGNPEFGFRIWQSGSGSGLNIKNEKVEFPSPNNDSTKFLSQKQHHHQKRPEDQEILRQNEGHHQHGLFHNNSYISIPGIQFDAKSRSFSEDELRPQPIIRKRKKNFVPDEKKDEKYWERRKKNNDAARMSREAKRQKENQIIMRAAHLETENSSLRSEIKNFNDQNDDIRTDVKHLQEKLATYEADNDDSGYF